MIWHPMQALLLLISLSLSMSAWAGEGNAERGKSVTWVRCAPCHHLHTPYIKVGPSLKGIYGKKPTISGVPFPVWNQDSLTAWLLNPRAIKANTRMLLPRLSDRDRQDIIAWLHQQSS